MIRSKERALLSKAYIQSPSKAWLLQPEDVKLSLIENVTSEPSNDGCEGTSPTEIEGILSKPGYARA